MKNVYIVSDLNFDSMAFSTREKAKAYVEFMAKANATSWVGKKKTPTKEDIALEKDAFTIERLAVHS